MKQKILLVICLGVLILPMYAYSATIKSIDFINVEERSRLKVSLDGKATYDVTRKDNKIILAINNTTIPNALARPFITKAFVTAVNQIIPSQKGKDVVFEITLKQTVPYLVSQDKGILFMDFDIPKEIKKVAEKETRKPERVAVVTQEVSKSVEKPETAKISIMESEILPEYTGRRLSMDFQNADIHNVLRIIADVSGLNIVTSDEVKGTVTIKLKDVPWDQALDVILESKDLDKMQMGNIVRIAPAGKIKEAQDRHLASQKAGEQLEPLVTSIIAVNFAKASEIAKVIKGKEVGIASERGSITAEDRTNVLIVRDIKRNVDAIQNMVNTLDKATPQVLIEARVVQADNDWVKGLGVQWGGSARNQSDRNHFGLSGITSGAASTLFSTTTPEAWSSTIVPTPSMVTNFSQPSDITSGVGLTLGRLGGTLAQLDLRLDMGESKGMTKVIARPRVVTMDNKKATIKQGEIYPFTVKNAEGEFSTEMKDLALVLEVTPRVAFDGSVNMEISVKRNALGAYINPNTGDPSIASREVQTEVLVKDGETSVIGGIIEEETKKNEEQIPKLGNIPGIGFLFKGKQDKSQQKELLIFITPKVISRSTPIVK